MESLLPVPFDRQKMHVYADSLKNKSVPALQAERAKVAKLYADLTSGALRGSRAEVREAQVKLAIADAALKRTGLKGFSFYLPEAYLSDEAYQQLKDGIANGMNG